MKIVVIETIFKMKHEKYFQQNNDFIQAAFNFVAPLSEYEQQKIQLEKDGKQEKKGFRRNFDFSKQADHNEIKAILNGAKKNKLNPVVELCNLAIRRYICKQKEKQYKKKVIGHTKAVPAPKYRSKEQLLEDTPENKKDFFENYLKPLFIGQGKTFVVDQHNKKVINQLWLYFIQSKDCKLDLTKGVCIVGPVGTGKSSLIKAFSRFCKDKGFENAFEVVSVKSIALNASGDGLGYLKQYKTGNFAFDDIAVRQKELNSFGSKFMLSDEIIQIRYERFEKLVPRPTHYTSNIDFNPNNQQELDKLEEIFDVRAIDRIKGSCNIIYLGGKSRR